MAQQPWVSHAATPELAAAKLDTAPAGTATKREQTSIMQQHWCFMQQPRTP